VVETATVSEPVTVLSPGQLFAGWRIERELARGGMGVLYLAHHPRLPRTDVIKVLSPLLSNDQRFRERFLREVTRMSTLSHPHLMTIHDSGETEDGMLYLVMPFVAGGDLRALLKKGGPLPPPRAAKLVSQLGAALDAAHRVGVVHRDVKPENVLLASVEPDDSDHALLTDFGISREDMAANTLTATGELLLTPAYASPEQVLGQTVDARADQYALACILYELLSGEPPFRNDVQVVMLMAHVQEPIPRLAARLGLPPAIDEVIARGMAKSPQERYPNCRALAQAATAALGVTAEIKHQDVDLRETLPTPPPHSPPHSPPVASAPQQTFVTHPPAPPGYQQAPGPAGTPFFPGVPPHQPKRGKRRLLIALLAVIVAAGVGVGVVLGTGGSKGSGTGAASSSPSSTSGQAPAAFTALLDRVPQNIRSSCTDITAKVAAPAQPFVATLADCHTTVGGESVIIDYRTLHGDAAAIKHYRTDLLGLGGTHHSPGNCQTFDSTDPTHQGTRGFAQAINQPPLVGELWCDTDGTLWYLQSSPGAGQLPIMTEVRAASGGGHAGAEARYANLVTIAPTV
jgi:serine/threonine protein kinase